MVEQPQDSKVGLEDIKSAPLPKDAERDSHLYTQVSDSVAHHDLNNKGLLIRLQKEIEELRLKIEQEKDERDCGEIGKYVGRGIEKPGNVACVTIIICFVLILLAGCLGFECFHGHQGSNFFKFLTVIGNIITLCLGYIFGYQAKHNN